MDFLHECVLCVCVQMMLSVIRLTYTKGHSLALIIHFTWHLLLGDITPVTITFTGPRWTVDIITHTHTCTWLTWDSRRTFNSSSFHLFILCNSVILSWCYFDSCSGFLLPDFLLYYLKYSLSHSCITFWFIFCYCGHRNWLSLTITRQPSR